MWEPLEAHFDWPEPAYEILDNVGIRDVFDRIMDRERWLFASNHRWEDLEGKLIGIVQTTPRRRPNYVYASDSGSRIVRPTQKTQPVLVKRLAEGDDIGTRISLVVLSAPEFNALRSQYMHPGIRPATPSIACGVILDQKLVGAFAFLGHSPHSPLAVYLLSDFPVAPTSYARLSKLIVMAAMSAEAQRLAQNMLSRRITDITTTAFSNRPVSMKYRSLLKLGSRKDSNEPAFKYQLNYDGPMGEWTLDEALNEWTTRWGTPDDQTSG